MQTVGAARRAIAEGKTSSRALVEAALDRTTPLRDAADGEKFMAADLEFHRLMALAARNGSLGDFLAGMHEHCQRLYFISVSREQHDARIMREHEEIFDALTRRDSAAAAAAVRKHVESLRKNVRDLLA